jgi:hypothetical protein
VLKNLTTKEINTEISATNPIRMTTWHMAAKKDTLEILQTIWA